GLIAVLARASTPPQSGIATAPGTVWLAVAFSPRGSHGERLTRPAQSPSDGSAAPGGSVVGAVASPAARPPEHGHRCGRQSGAGASEPGSQVYADDGSAPTPSGRGKAVASRSSTTKRRQPLQVIGAIV